MRANQYRRARLITGSGEHCVPSMHRAVPRRIRLTKSHLDSLWTITKGPRSRKEYILAGWVEMILPARLKVEPIAGKFKWSLRFRSNARHGTCPTSLAARRAAISTLVSLLGGTERAEILNKLHL
jgi:hypothetical protein